MGNVQACASCIHRERSEIDKHLKCLRNHQCHNDHPLIDFLADSKYFYCDVCRASQRLSAPLRSCRICRYDICEECIASALRTDLPASVRMSYGPKRVSFAPPATRDEISEAQEAANSRAQHLIEDAQFEIEDSCDGLDGDDAIRLQSADAAEKAKLEEQGRRGKRRISLAEMTEEMFAVAKAAKAARDVFGERQRRHSHAERTRRHAELLQQTVKVQRERNPEYGYQEGLQSSKLPLMWRESGNTWTSSSVTSQESEAELERQASEAATLQRLADAELADALRVPVVFEAGNYVSTTVGSADGLKRVLDVMSQVADVKILIHCHSCVRPEHRESGMRLCKARGEVVEQSLRALGAQNPLETVAWADTHPDVGRCVLIRMSAAVF